MESSRLLAEDLSVGHDASEFAETSARTASPSVSTPDESEASDIPPGVARRLFVSHFLSTWNNRLFEFGAVLFIAEIFPGTLLPASLYALIRGASAMLLAPLVGRYVDRHNRLQVVRSSISTPFLSAFELHLRMSAS